MTRVTEVIYTNFNVTQCNEKCDFFQFSTQRPMQQVHDLLSEYLGLNVYFIPYFLTIY